MSDRIREIFSFHRNENTSVLTNRSRLLNYMQLRGQEIS